MKEVQAECRDVFRLVTGAFREEESLNAILDVLFVSSFELLCTENHNWPSGSFEAAQYGEMYVGDWTNLSYLLGKLASPVEPPDGFLTAEPDPALLRRVLPRRVLLPLLSGV